MATPKRRKTSPMLWQQHPEGGQYITYKKMQIVKKNGKYAVKIGSDNVIVTSFAEGKKFIDIYTRSKQKPPFEWQFHHPVEGWYYANYMLGAIKKDRNSNFTYTTDRKRWRKAKSLADAQAKIRAFCEKWYSQFK